MAVNAYLAGSLLLFGLWLSIWLGRPRVRRKMLWTSVLTMPLGLTEPLFVPAYWTPPSLLDLAARTGFDLESLLFSFAVGGVASVAYDALLGRRTQHIPEEQRSHRRHRFHRWALTAPIPTFVLLELLTVWNPIYTASLAMLAGALATTYCRPDLVPSMATGGAIFLALYFLVFEGIALAYPSFVADAWNLGALSGWFVLSVPIEELLFAGTFGTLWSSVYEHALWLHRV